MAWRPTDASTDMPLRPSVASQQSNSLPSTPYQHSRGLSFRSRSPSPRRRSTSPHSTQSETNPLSSYRKPLGGCKYETGMAFFRRRMPYSLGGDLLPEEKVGLKERLSPEEEEKLNREMGELYDRLLPSAESDDRRRQLVRKLEKLFNKQWPGNDIKVHVFGSSGNKLCSSDSDVDICITTPYKELEHVCLLAEVLANHGMERVVCVSHAKVPIVKIWDPELKLACDMNVNNTLALENTRMIRTYVDIDERVRPLAMIIKYWTKRRVLNDAALGGTLSSYTWICMIINFLQTRDPPILPSLQTRPHKQRVTPNGVQVSFDDNMDSLVGFGRKNKQSLAELLFQFFRYYGHEFDYEKHVISVREGKLISKEGKGWHLLQNNRLCVEEPFNTTRNLGNTADDTSFRGVHMELRRAFKAVAEADLEKCCEQYVFPPEEERVWEKPPPQPRPILAPTPSHPSSRGGRGGGRGARHSNQYGRGGNNNSRRTSGAANRTGNNNNNNFRPNHLGLTPEMTLQAQHAQFLLHDQLYQQIQILQAQEQELRMQLHNQSLLTGRPPPVLIRQPLIQFSFPQPEVHADENSRTRAGTVNHPPLTSSLRQPIFYSPSYFPVSVSGVQGSNTNPPSPSATAAVPDLRRNPRRPSGANGSPGGSLRSHSQPARSVHSPVMQNLTPLYSPPQPSENSQSSRERFMPGSPGGNPSESESSSFLSNGLPSFSPPALVDEHRPSEYVGYYLGGSAQQQAYHQSLMAMSLPAPTISPFVANVPEYRSSGLVYPEPFGSLSDHGSVPNTQDMSPPTPTASRPTPPHDRGPLIIDGSVPLQDRDHSDKFGHYEDDFEWDTPARTSDGLSADSQEPRMFESDPHFSTPQQNQEGYSQVVADKALMNGQDARSDALSSQFQNLHVSNLDGNAESPSTPEGKKAKQGQTAERLPAKESTTRDKHSTTGGSNRHTGSDTSSPTARRRLNGFESEKVNGISHKGKPKGGQEATQNSSPNAVDRKDPQPTSLPRKPDGLSPASGGRDSGTASANGGWQTTKRKHKRHAKSTAEAHHVNGVEPLPADESMRKGG
ncbi:hypothetical protein VTN77DRAFT_2961 [Rasamsonia byssochlamydoides]|uniref:uncharacterized protein n=1 Tax=Rasamsonia byssochlamydoides TaxID=89139 RepID=UPI003743F328